MKHAFEENIKINISSAQIGISCANWDFSEANWSEAEAKAMMQSNSYDILPIKNENGKFESYWSTSKTGDFAKIAKHQIADSDKIDYLTELSDLLFKFQASENSSYFLIENSEVNGLVSNVHLNSKPVYVYFYNLISKVEIDLGHWLKELVAEQEMIVLIQEKNKNPKDELSAETLKRYEEDKKLNHENHFVEYIYLSQFFYIIKKKQLSSTLGYQSNQKLENDFKIISTYRNWFAHPLNSPKNNLNKDFYKLNIALENLISNLESISIELIKAYYKTTYQTISDPKFSIQIGIKNTKLNNYLKDWNYENWSFITAENPNSIKLSCSENEKRNEKLEKYLIKGKYKYICGIGIPFNADWKAENSFLVFNLGITKSLSLCSEFQQNAFVYGGISKIAELKRIKTSGNNS